MCASYNKDSLVVARTDLFRSNILKPENVKYLVQAIITTLKRNDLDHKINYELVVQALAKAGITDVTLNIIEKNHYLDIEYLTNDIIQDLSIYGRYDILSNIIEDLCSLALHGGDVDKVNKIIDTINKMLNCDNFVVNEQGKCSYILGESLTTNKKYCQPTFDYDDNVVKYKTKVYRPPSKSNKLYVAEVIFSSESGKRVELEDIYQSILDKENIKLSDRSIYDAVKGANGLNKDIERDLGLKELIQYEKLEYWVRKV